MTQDGTGVRRTLVVVRHAQAATRAVSDHERALTEQGIQDARALGAWLGERLPAGASVRALVSSATRARQTWQHIELAVPAGIEVLDELYQAAPEQLLELVADLDDAVEVAVVVGHNPTVQAAVERLSDGSSPAAEELRRAGFAPATAAVIELADGWQHLAEGSGSLLALHVPGARPVR
jgi:phosphohistidine phosphatase